MRQNKVAQNAYKINIEINKYRKKIQKNTLNYWTRLISAITLRRAEVKSQDCGRDNQEFSDSIRRAGGLQRSRRTSICSFG